MKKMILLLFTTLLVLQSCRNRWIAPPYTEVSKIIEVKPGMSIRDVSNILGIDPYDVYHLQEQEGSSVLIYNYRLKDRRMEVPLNPNRSERLIRSNQGQTSGEPWYGESARLYCLFKDGKLQSLITDGGRSDSEYLLITNNDIQLIAKEKINSYIIAEEPVAPSLNQGNTQAQTIINLNNSGNSNKERTSQRLVNRSENPNPKASTRLDERNKRKGGKITGYAVAGVLTIGLTIMLAAIAGSAG